jgi:TPR repeat protein
VVAAIVAALASFVIGAFLFGYWMSGAYHPLGPLGRAEMEYGAGDYRAAVDLFAQLAAQGDPLAQYWLAHMTELGLGVHRDPQKAIDLYRKAAAQDVVPAEVSLGEVYLYGDMVPPDYAAAARYLKQAALHGNARAATLIGQIYQAGLGVPADSAKAYAWFEVATLEGSAFARAQRDTALRALTPAAQEAAIAQARSILASVRQSKSGTGSDAPLAPNKADKAPPTRQGGWHGNAASVSANATAS